MNTHSVYTFKGICLTICAAKVVVVCSGGGLWTALYCVHPF